ncbi:hypoxanthine phosphoribosyltransferase [Mycoplasmopsis glycophila]|uniref:Hypoxanthine phosphoribosyltransferase n=1 Tax=Mycoplasmopsis glycophila TaxID=171285 RepID=A0A449AV58_9BACT|nr:hypoxanthine phosphoribosyltransferase [Mycoplasmopsis glycophila]VEU70360.1 hypoxanthine-guanine phosphoribosyltransferases [Mycoplasmopsis glycophila]
MKNHPKIKKILFDQEFIEQRILDCSNWINQTYANSDNLILVGLLKGSVPFLAQLIKNVKIDHAIDFMTASSYAGTHASTGNVKIIMDLAQDITGKDVLVVEDIIDSGITLSKIKEILLARHPRSLKIITLMDKPYNRKVDLHADFYGFQVPDEFLVGYGLDYQEQLRNLPFVGVFDEKYLIKK